MRVPRAVRRTWGQLKLGLDLPANLRSWQLSRAYHIGDCKRIYLYHIRKTGGTSVTQMLLALGGEDGRDVYARMTHSPNYRTISADKVYVGWNKQLIEQGHYFYAFSHIPAHELSLPPETFTVTSLRDPVERVISLYKMLIEYRDTGKPHPAMRKQGQWLGDSFAEFLSRIPKEHLLRQVYMFSQSYSPDEAFERVAQCSLFFFLEDFARGAQALAAKLNIQLEPVHVHQSKGNPEVRPHELEELRFRLQPEYELCSRLQQVQPN
jgi:hypothetical protein